MKFIIAALVVLLVIRLMGRTTGVGNISTNELKNILKDSEKQFVDVRTQAEYKGRHIPEFKNIPLHLLADQAASQLKKDKEVVVICQSGIRSQRASKLFKKLGFEQVTNVKGGMSAWKS